MAKPFSSPLPSQTASISFIKQPNNVPSNLASTSSMLWGSHSARPGEVPMSWNVQGGTKYVKPKKRTLEEKEITAKTAARMSARLAQDHQAVLFPETETAFTDMDDVVKRLLPYHVFQLPKDDTGKGKGKAVDDIKETKFALECFRRRRALEERFHKATTRPGKRSAPSDQAYCLAHIVLESERGETAALNAELRAARSELDRARDKRTSTAPYRAQAYYNTAAQPYYRGYQYAYAQPYGAQTTSFTAPTATSTSASTNTNYVPQTTPTAIPVQLPATSLPALQALGIVPAAPSNNGQSQAAILRSSSADGTLLNLEINLSLLQSAQMNGLLLLLNTLSARNSTTNTVSAPAVTNSSSAE